MITVTQYIEYAITIPGLQGPPILIKVPAGLPPPVVTASPSVVRENPGVMAATVALPAFVSRKRPTSITVNGQPRTVSACIALLLEAKRRGDKLRARPETIRKFEAELPELAGFLKRDESRKGHGGMVPVCFGVGVG